MQNRGIPPHRDGAGRPLWFFGLLFLVLASCTQGVAVVAPEGLREEEKRLAAILTTPVEAGGAGLRSARTAESASLVIRLGASWLGDPSIPAENAASSLSVGRSYYAPVRVFPCERSDASSEACFAGSETILRIDEITPPYVALTVDGFYVDDPEYPLIRETRAEFLPKGLRGRKAEREVRRVLSECGAMPPKLVTLAVVGDLMVGRGIDERLMRSGAASVVDARILKTLRSADIAIGNLEGALTERGKRASKAYTFRSPPEAALYLADMGFDALLVSNNHSFDWGLEGFLDTLAALERAGILPLGGGGNLKEAESGRALALGASELHLFGYGSFPREGNGWDGTLAAAGESSPGILYTKNGEMDRMASAFSVKALDIVAFHGGHEWFAEPDMETKSLCRRLVDGGADAVFGSHPHVVQGMEWYKGKPIFWSLGNFIFPGMDGTPGGQDGLLIEARFWEDRVLYMKALPVVLSSTGVGQGGAGGALLIQRSRNYARDAPAPAPFLISRR